MNFSDSSGAKRADKARFEAPEFRSNGRSGESVITKLIYLSSSYYGACAESVAICLTVKLLDTTTTERKREREERRERVEPAFIAGAIFSATRLVWSSTLEHTLRRTRRPAGASVRATGARCALRRVSWYLGAHASGESYRVKSRLSICDQRA